MSGHEGALGHMGEQGSADHYVSGGVNWAAFTLEQLVSMVADKASVPQLERLAEDWRTTGDGMVDAADYLAEALDDLMDFWSGESAEQARHTVALNAQWVGDLGLTAKEMGDPIEEAAGALKAAQEAMPKLPEVPPASQPSSAPRSAEEAAAVTDGSPLGAAIGASAAGSESALQAQAEQEELKRVAVETMQRFEAAALGIDRATPRFEAPSTELRPREEDDAELLPGRDVWISTVNMTAGVDMRWQVLTGLDETRPSSHGDLSTVSAGSGAGGLEFASRGGYAGVGAGGSGGVLPGPLSGRAATGDGVDHVRGFAGRGLGVPTAPAGALPTSGSTAPGMMGPMGAAPMAGMGAGAQAGGQPHRRRVPFDGDDPFDTGQKASPPVIGL